MFSPGNYAHIYVLVGSVNFRNGSVPMTSLAMASFVIVGWMGRNWLHTSSMYGHCFRYLKDERDFRSGGMPLLIFRSSVFKGRRTGGRSGLRLILSVWFLRLEAPINHWILWRRSRKRTIIPLPAFLPKRWHAARSDALASLTSRCILARSMHASRLSSSCSSASPFRPCMVWLSQQPWYNSEKYQ